MLLSLFLSRSNFRSTATLIVLCIVSTSIFLYPLPYAFSAGEWILEGSSKQVVAANDKSGNLVLFSIGTDDQPYYKYQFSPGGDWSSWVALEAYSKEITVGNDRDGHLEALMIQYDNDLYRRSLEEGNLLPTVRDKSMSVELVSEGLSFPTSMVFLDENTILVTQKYDGKVRLISNSKLSSQPVLDLPVNSSGESGLLGIAIPQSRPSNTNSTLVFLYSTEAAIDDGEAIGNRVYKYEWNGKELVNPELILDLPAVFMNHAGGKLKVDSNGDVYGVIGDQNKTSILQNIPGSSSVSDTGMVFRINQDGTPDERNPFFNKLSNRTVDKYYAYGIRNSFGITFDPVTGDLWMTENGPEIYDEINLVQPGFNSGWRTLMGPMSRSNVTTNDLFLLDNSEYSDPELSWLDTIGITDIEFLNSSKLGDKYQNNIFVGDINNGVLYYLEINANRTGIAFNDNNNLSDLVVDDASEASDLVFGTGFAGITDIETGPDGYLYILTFGGSIYRIIPTASLSLGTDAEVNTSESTNIPPFSPSGTESPSIPIEVILIGVGVAGVVAILVRKMRAKNSA